LPTTKGPAARLDVPPKFAKEVERVVSGKKMFETLEVILMDEYGNATADNGISVTLSITKEKDIESVSVEMPRIKDEGNLTVKSENGKAVFVGVKTEDGVGKTSDYYLCIRAVNQDMEPSFVQFFFKNGLCAFFFSSFFLSDLICWKTEKEDLQYKDELRQRQVNLKKEVVAKKNEFSNINSEIATKQQELEDADNRLSSLKKKLTAFLDSAGTEEQARKTVEQAVQSMKNIEEIIKNTTKSIQQFEKNPIRESTHGTTTSIFEEMQSILARQGASSGIVGAIVDLAFIDDEKEAMVYSRVIGARMHAFVLVDHKVTCCNCLFLFICCVWN
jgi:hypothetical protein